MPLLLLDYVNAAPAPHNVNASGIGTGVARGINWTNESSEPTVWCGIACYYMEVSTAKISPETLYSYNPVAWPGPYSNSMPNLAWVARQVATPEGDIDSYGREIVWDSSTWLRGSVDVTRAGDSMTTKVYKSGNQPSGQAGTASAALAYHVQAQNQGSMARDFFIRFTAPNRTHGASVPYYIGGPSGNQPFNVNQKKYAKSRSAVDILVNGLPVWSTAGSYIIPEETSSSTDYSGFTLEWGYESDNDSYTVFVGRFASGEIFNIDFIARADSFARAPTCGQVTESFPTARAIQHCFSINEGRGLPDSVNEPVRFEIYSKVVSTPIYQLPGGSLGQLTAQ